ncbi:hypothetical protein QOZ80_6BG0482460 [Eleusine coracana subsp. coracana]|nr:hypothetical protein QOZ80_6BG0482460 [Eleusine coracana subsp. coracana]
MPQVSAPSPLGSSRRPAAPLDGSDTSSGEESEPDGDETTPTTHTVVFLPPVLGGPKPRPGRGLVLDERWSVTAKFTAGASVDMVGACCGLVCLLDVRTCAVRVFDPVTGESLHPPPAPCTSATRRDPRAYCFGFDAAAGRYKILHFPNDDNNKSQQSSVSNGVHVHSLGDKYWKPVRAAACCLSAGGGVYSNGAVYWLTHYKVAMARLMLFDLREETIVSVDLPPFDDGHHRRPLYCRLMEADARPCVVTSLRHDPKSGDPFAAACNDDIDVWRLGEDEGRWSRACVLQLRRMPRHVPGPLAVRRWHVLMQGEDGALLARRVKEGGVARVERAAGEKVLVEGSSSPRGRGGAPASPCGGGERRARVKRESAVPIMGVLAPCYRDRLRKIDEKRADLQREKAQADRAEQSRRRGVIRTFGYVEPVSNASLDQRLGIGASRLAHGGPGKVPGGHGVTPGGFPSSPHSCTPCNRSEAGQLLLQETSGLQPRGIRRSTAATV